MTTNSKPENLRPLAWTGAFRKIVVSASALALLTVGSVAGAREASLVGSWRASQETARGVLTFNCVIGSDGSYSLQAALQTVAGSLMTWQKGYYQFTSPDTVSFVVEDWEPKSQSVYHTDRPYDDPLVRGHMELEEVGKPPGGTYRIRFTSPDSFTSQDVNSGDSADFVRVR